MDGIGGIVSGRVGGESIPKARILHVTSPRWSGKKSASPQSPPLGTVRACFHADGSSMDKRAAQHAVGPSKLGGNLHGTAVGPATELLRWWQPHQQRPLQS